MEGKGTRPIDIRDVDGHEIRVYEDEDGGLWYAACDVRAACRKPRERMRPPFATHVYGQWPMQKTLQLIRLDALMRFAVKFSPFPLRKWRVALQEEELEESSW